jgi:hypothetical protein
MSFLREPREGKIERAVLTIALVMAAALLVLAVATLIGLTVRGRTASSTILLGLDVGGLFSAYLSRR